MLGSPKRRRADGAVGFVHLNGLPQKAEVISVGGEMVAGSEAVSRADASFGRKAKAGSVRKMACEQN